MTVLLDEACQNKQSYQFECYEEAIVDDNCPNGLIYQHLNPRLGNIVECLRHGNATKPIEPQIDD